MFSCSTHAVRALTLLGFLSFGGTSLVADEPVDVANTAKALAKLDTDLLGEDADDMLRKDLRTRLQATNDRASAVWRNIDSVAEWEKYRDARLKLLERSLGEFPAPPKDLHARVTGRVEGDGFVIENTVFQSRPGLWVTANVYVPSGQAASDRTQRPGIILGPAHHTPKEDDELQDMGMTWARNGCVVLVMDYIGYGERRQHPFDSSDEYAGDFRRGRQDYYFRYDSGVQLQLVGDSLLGWMVYDLRRGIDYLTQRPDVDDSKIIMLGSVAGGGEPVAATAALDKRVAGAVVFNFGGPQPETRYPLPDDAETWFNYAGSAYWESTRNQRLSAAGAGFQPWVVVGALAPRPLGYAHEFSWDREHDPVWKRYEKLYAMYGKPENLAGVHGRGELSGRPPAASHCTHIGKIHRRMIHPVFRKWFGIDVQPDEEYHNYIDPSRLKAMTPEAKQELQPKQLVEILPKLADERMARARAKYEDAGAAQRESLRAIWNRVLMPVNDIPSGKNQQDESKIAAAQVGSTDTETVPGARVLRIVLEAEPRIKIPLLLVRPTSSAAAREGKLPIVVAVAPAGKQKFLERRQDEIAKLLKQGIAVCLPDLRGTGETRPGPDRSWQGSATSRSATEMMLGGTMVGEQLRDLQAVLAWLRTRDDVDGARIAVWGDSFARTNGPDTDFKIPRRVAAWPHQSEPGGTLLALLAGLYDDDLAAVYASGGLGEFRSVLTSWNVLIPHDAAVPGLLTTGDQCDVAAAIAPRPLRLSGLVDERNRPLELESARKTYARTQAAYERADAADVFTISTEDDSPADWLGPRLQRGQ